MGEPALSLVVWRKFVRQRGGVLMTLLLVLLLAFGGRTCPMMAHADDSAPLPETHGCCHGKVATPDAPADSDYAPQPCDSGPCLQAVGPHDAADRHGSPTSQPDWPPFAVIGLLPPDWLSNSHSLPSFVAETTGPPPPQRSLVLRL
jgi:hypothetical protein